MRFTLKLKAKVRLTRERFWGPPCDNKACYISLHTNHLTPKGSPIPKTLTFLTICSQYISQQLLHKSTQY